ncbi:MAG: hypothetical protein F4X18_10830 [Acidimicrobiia bacterium]|nr:hypothetical protein [Acidimicrobiia bacterium]MYC85991.1 hypothetical protein [Acidimicrobiia bacterium]
MLWLTRPPYLRWSLVGLLVIISLWVEIRPASTVRHPYVTRDVARGDPVEGAIEWRTVAGGVLEPVLGSGFADRDLTAGHPLLPGDTTDAPLQVPRGWWLLDVAVPTDTTAGMSVQLVILPSSGERALPPIGGLVTSVRPGDYQSDGLVGSVAFPPDRAATAAVAIAEDRVSVLIEARRDRDAGGVLDGT